MSDGYNVAGVTSDDRWGLGLDSSTDYYGSSSPIDYSYGAGSYTDGDNSWASGLTGGLGGYGDATTSSTGSVISGAANGYANGGWAGAVVGGLAGYFGSKDKNKQSDKDYKRQMELTLAQSKYAEEVRQKKIQEQKDMVKLYEGYKAPPMAGILSGNSPMAFQQAQVNPEQNSYGLLRG